MTNIRLPNKVESRDNLITAFTYKDGSKKYNYTTAELDLIMELYEKYDRNRGNITETDNEITSVSQTLKDATKIAYNEVQKKNRLSDFRKELLSLSNKCPICRFTSATTLDHQLPKDKFEVFSIYSRNLAPMCTTCNNLKRTCEVGNTEDSFYHIYYDNLPNEHFLKAILSVENENYLSFTFIIEQSTNMTTELFNKLSFIFERLGLDERLNAEVNEFLSDLKVSFNQQDDITINVFLEDLITHQVEQYGYNHWKTSILISLQDSTEFCTSLYKTYNED